MESKYWLDKWAAKDTQFHKEVPNAQMVAYFTQQSPRKVAVPLCGKSLDMIWLMKQGNEVVGFELSQLACDAFFEENAISFQKETKGEGIYYRSEKISIWCGDIFKSPSELWRGVGSIYDRAALVALPPDMRSQYASFLAERIAKESTYFLITYEYSADTELGPPFSVSEREVRTLFERQFRIRKIAAGKDADLSHRPGKFSATEVTEHVYELTKLSL